MISAALVGLGRIGSLLEDDQRREKPASHAGAILGNRKLRLIAAADISAKRRHAFCKRWGQQKIYASTQELLEKCSPDILFLATPTQHHLEGLSQALASNVKVVVLEKPLGSSLEEIQQAKKNFSRILTKKYPFSSKKNEPLRHAHALGFTRVLVNHERRFASDYNLLRQNMIAGKYGKLLEASAYFFTPSKAAWHEILLHDGTHLLDAFSFLLASENAAAMKLAKLASSALQATEKNTQKNTLILRELAKQYLYTGKLLSPAYKIVSAHLTKQEKANQAETLQCLSKFQAHSSQGLEIPLSLHIGRAREYFHFEISLWFEKAKVCIGNGFFTEEFSKKSPYYKGFRSLIKEKKSLGYQKTYFFRNMVRAAVSLAQEPLALSPSSMDEAELVFQFKETLLKLVSKKS